MKYYLENGMGYGSTAKPSQVLSHLFTVLGSGVKLDNKGYLRGNYRSDEDFELGGSNH